MVRNKGRKSVYKIAVNAPLLSHFNRLWRDLRVALRHPSDAPVVSAPGRTRAVLALRSEKQYAILSGQSTKLSTPFLPGSRAVVTRCIEERIIVPPTASLAR